MSVKIMLGGTLVDGVLNGGAELTDVTRLTLRLTFRSGLDTRDPNAMQVVIDRNVGEKINAPADQLAFKLLRGVNNKAGIKVFPATIELIDDNQHQSIGKWAFGEAFVTALSTADSGQRVSEAVSLAANKVVYTKTGGPATPLLDVNS
ncbi:MAG: hypothetical protein U1A77_18810 [Pirellulales bacterium]